MGLQCYQGIKVDIFTPEGDPLKTELKNTKDGKYSVAYTPHCVGQRSLKIQLNGQPLVDGSPCVMEVREHQMNINLRLSLDQEGGDAESLIALGILL